jgi:hypothetical protein
VLTEERARDVSCRAAGQVPGKVWEGGVAVWQVSWSRRSHSSLMSLLEWWDMGSRSVERVCGRAWDCTLSRRDGAA